MHSRSVVYSIQAITLSTRIAHNLGRSDLNATMAGAAIRIAHCLGLHQIDTKDEYSEIVSPEDWYRTVEVEVGRRCWLQLLIQDFFQIPFTNAHRTYAIATRPCRSQQHEKLTFVSDQSFSIQNPATNQLPRRGHDCSRCANSNNQLVHPHARPAGLLDASNVRQCQIGEGDSIAGRHCETRNVIRQGASRCHTFDSLVPHECNGSHRFR
jgi:hypothetical protein